MPPARQLIPAQGGLIVALTLAHWAVLAFKLPLLTSLPGWFYQATDKPAGSVAVLALLAGLVAAACALLMRPGAAVRTRLLLLIFIGAGFQHGIALTEGQGINGLRHRAEQAGHAQFFEVAGKIQQPMAVLRGYHRMANEGQLGRFAQSKPPGHLAFYLLNHRLAGLLHRADSVEGQIAWTRTVSAYLWPLLACLAALPLFLLVRLLLGDPQRALLAAAFYLFVPSVCLITMHADQVLYPSLFLASSLLAALALVRRSIPLSLGAGAACYLASAVSFPLGSAALLAAPGLVRLCPREAALSRRRAALLLLGVTAGAAAAWLLLRLTLAYEPLEHYRRAMAYHGTWQHWDWSPGAALGYAAKNTLELSTWLGAPLSILAAGRIGRAVTGLAARRSPPARGDLLAAAAMALLLAVLLLGRIKAELPRLGLFLVPALAALSADALAGLTAAMPRGAPLAPAGVIMLQAVTVYLTRRFQDFC